MNERLCKLCSENEVEDEIHFLLKCPNYNDERIALLNQAITLNQNFINLPIAEQVKFLMNNLNLIKHVAKYVENVCSTNYK